MAERIGHLTRFPSLTLGVNVQQGQRSLSWTGSGVLIPCEEKASDVFRRHVLPGHIDEAEQQVGRLKLGQSIIDAVAGQARQSRKPSRPARPRSAGSILHQRSRARTPDEDGRAQWERKPKPKPAVRPLPIDPAGPHEYMDKVRLMYDMVAAGLRDRLHPVDHALARQRELAGDRAGGRQESPTAITTFRTTASPSKLAQLKAIDAWHMKLLAALLSKLKTTREGGESLLDRTMVLFGSNFGNANKHTTNNMPVLLAGGGFRHGQHLAFDKDRNYPLPNLFVSMLQRIGIESDKFASSTGTLRGLEAKA